MRLRGAGALETQFTKACVYCPGVLLRVLTSLSGLFLFYCNLSDFFLTAGSMLPCIFPLTWTLRLNFSLFSFLPFLLPLCPPASPFFPSFVCFYFFFQFSLLSFPSITSFYCFFCFSSHSFHPSCFLFHFHHSNL